MKPNCYRAPTHNQSRKEKLPSSAALDMVQGDLSYAVSKANVVAFTIANKPHSLQPACFCTSTILKLHGLQQKKLVIILEDD